MGAVLRTASSKNSFVQFGELHVQIFARCSAPNCTPAQVIGAVRGRFINSFTRWRDITQPNYYH